MSTDGEKPLNGRPEPFRRPVAWGRPPQTVFRTGPLPTSGPPADRTAGGRALPPGPVGPSILGGSMIPRAAPRPAPALALTDSVPAPVPRPESAVEVPSRVLPEPDLIVRALPEPRPMTEPAGLDLDALPAFKAVASDAAVSAAPPRLSGSAAGQRTSGRAVLIGGMAVAGVAALAAVAWWVLRPPAEAPAVGVSAMPLTVVVAEPATADPVPVVTAAEPAPESAPAPMPEPAPEPTAAPVTPSPRVEARRPPAPAPAPAPVRPAPIARAVEPSRTAPAPPVSAPAVVIEASPAPSTGPTAAERPSDDVDAPIATRPQPIG